MMVKVSWHFPIIVDEYEVLLSCALLLWREENQDKHRLISMSRAHFFLLK